MPNLSSKVQHLNGSDSEYMINWKLVDLVNGSAGALSSSTVADADIMPIVDGAAGIANQKTITVGNLKTYIQDAVNELSEMGGVTLEGTIADGEILVSDGGDYINAVVSGGAQPYTFLWSNGATTEDVTGLSAGAYSLTVTDKY